LALPGVETGLSYGTPALRVKGRFLARLREDGETVAIRIPFEERDILLRSDPKVFLLTDHCQGHPAILVRLAEVQRFQLEEVLEQAWRARASKRVVSAYDAGLARRA
jgi:hypothetical protein